MPSRLIWNNLVFFQKRYNYPNYLLLNLMQHDSDYLFNKQSHKISLNMCQILLFILSVKITHSASLPWYINKVPVVR